MGDEAERMMDNGELDEDDDGFLMDGTGDFVSENFHDYVNGTWLGREHPALMTRQQHEFAIASARHELHHPHKDSLDLVLEKSKRIMVVGEDSKVTKFGKGYKNVEELRARLIVVEEQVKELSQEREFLRGQLDNWTGDTESCQKCGKSMAKRKGKYGEFWGCTGFPNCNGTRKVE